MHSLRVLAVGGGPGGLFLARLLRLSDPTAHVVVHERNRRSDAFGFGIVFSDRTMSAIEAVDPETYRHIVAASASWTDLELRRDGRRLRFGGYGFTAISRRVLLDILQQQAERAGAELVFSSPVGPVETVGADADVVVLADGVGSVNRDGRTAAFGARVEPGRAKFIWFGTQAGFDAVTFPFVHTRYGAFAAHAYPYGGGMSTFIVETAEATWLAAGLDAATAAAEEAGETDEYSRRLLTEVFADHLAGSPLVGNNSRWASFRLVHNERWSDGRAVLLGDAAHTAHFSVGSGTKIAMEDAIALRDALLSADSVGAAFAAYERARRPAVARTQRAAVPSMHWWETFADRLAMPMSQFGLHFVTRTGAISYAGLRRRHADPIDAAETDFATRAVSDAQTTASVRGGTAMRLPLRIGPLVLRNRIVTQVAGDARRQRAQAAALAAGGSALVLADWSAAAAEDLPAWRHTAWDLQRGRCLLGAVVTVEGLAQAVTSALAAGVVLLEIGLGEVDQTTERDALERARSRVLEGGREVPLLFAGLAPAPGPEWSADADRLVARCRALAADGLVGGFRVRAEEVTDAAWPRSVGYADRIRAATGLPVIVDGARDGALNVARHAGADDWPTRLHLAVVTGRADLVTTWPLGDPATPAIRQGAAPNEPFTALPGLAPVPAHVLEGGAR
jgi:anthraniloyl-CoA monooxygenase